MGLNVNLLLTCRSLPSLSRLENYSCKMVSEEKRQYKDLVSRLEIEGEQSSCLRLSSSRTIRGLRELTGLPISRSSYQMSSSQAEADDNVSSRNRSRTSSSCSEEGSLNSPTKASQLSITAKEFFCLMSTLNLSFNSAYDFLTAESDEFCLEPELRASIVKHYISRLCSIYVDKYELLAPKLWLAINEAIVPHKCVIYSYRPNHASDPYSSGCLASFNYFFCNRDLKRILFFSLRVLNESPAEEQFEDEMQDIF
ncbi:unnamed protein product [Mesocestoides corti]|uniref:Repressor of RNA polymerase III transcription MAF1 homolog n=1 Tax=Mesocestoides corti TaxID=53468 RepID=A0A0R3UN85_MESCO|nr:unnamed protein product [Mesocestoides corti]